MKSADGVQIAHAQAIALGVWYQAEQIWIWKSRVIDDSSRSTVGKIVTCLTIFSGGWMLSRISSGVFANRILEAVPAQQRRHVGDPLAGVLLRCWLSSRSPP